MKRRKVIQSSRKKALASPNERETFYSSRLSQVYEWPDIGTVIGFRNGKHFTIEDLRVQSPRQGDGAAILEWLAGQYTSIRANWVLPESLGFWVKMQHLGLIDGITMESGSPLMRQSKLESNSSNQ